MVIETETLIATISALIAILSATYARKAADTAQKTHNVELIGQLYSIYQSDEMLKNLRINWRIYKKLWEEVGTDTKENLLKNADFGVPLPTEKAINYFKDLDHDSDEFKAIHYTINFWTYVELLLIKKSVTPKEIKSFTSPNLLGFLVSMSKAYSAKYPSPGSEDEHALEYSYKLLVNNS